MNKNQKKILDNISKGLIAYEQDVDSMTDKELWEHCFDEPDVREKDYCIQVLKKRFFRTSSIKTNDHL